MLAPPIADTEPSTGPRGTSPPPASDIAASTEEELVNFLGSPTAYDEPTRSVVHVETHISHVFLTDRHAYKLKKPVRFEFLDFSTAELRRRACEDETRLNRRMAADVYLGVVPIRRSQEGRLSLGGDGTFVEAVVKMRRLAAETSLESLIRSGQVAPRDVERLALFLAKFYTAAAPIIIDAGEYRRAVERHCQANSGDLSAWAAEAQGPGAAHLVRRLTAMQRRWLTLGGNVLEQRACDGRIVDGHGDLRPEHVFLTPRPVVIDCLEFSRELRQVDVADELSFLAMECERLGASPMGTRLLEVYEQQSGDRVPPDLIAFYKSYRATVRAKVAALRSRQTPPADRECTERLAVAYLERAVDHAEQLGPPLLLVVRGLSGTGKSTLAEALANVLALEHLQTDRVRREIFPEVSAQEFDHGVYSPENRQRVYEALLAQAEAQLGAGLSVVVDGTFLAAGQLLPFCNLATRRGAILLVIDCACPQSVARQRIERRQQRPDSVSDATAATHDRQRASVEAVPGDMPRLAVDTTWSLPQQVAAVCERLRRQGPATRAGA